jgi:hypothetical protein
VNGYGRQVYSVTADTWSLFATIIADMRVLLPTSAIAYYLLSRIPAGMPISENQTLGRIEVVIAVAYLQIPSLESLFIKKYLDL